MYAGKASESGYIQGGTTSFHQSPASVMEIEVPKNVHRMSTIHPDTETLEELGHEAIVFIYGYNVNLYKDVFHVPRTSSTLKIYRSYLEQIKKLEFALKEIREMDGEDDSQRLSALRWGMKPSQLDAGMRPQDFIEIKIDAIKRAYQILADSKSRKDYDYYFDHIDSMDVDGCDENSHLSGDRSREREHIVTTERTATPGRKEYDAIPLSVETHSEYTGLSFFHNEEIFDPFKLHDEVDDRVRFKGFDPEYNADSWTGKLQELSAPVTPDSCSTRKHISINEIENESISFVCPLPTSDDDSVSTYSEDDKSLLNEKFRKYSEKRTNGRRVKFINLEPEECIPPNLTRDEEKELAYLHSFAKTLKGTKQQSSSELDNTIDDIECFSYQENENVNVEDKEINRKKEGVPSETDVKLQNILCFSHSIDGDSINGDSINSEIDDNMSYDSFGNEYKIDGYRHSQGTCSCIETFIDEVAITFDGTVNSIDRLCGGSYQKKRLQ